MLSPLLFPLRKDGVVREMNATVLGTRLELLHLDGVV